MKGKDANLMGIMVLLAIVGWYLLSGGFQLPTFQLPFGWGIIPWIIIVVAILAVIFISKLLFFSGSKESSDWDDEEVDIRLPYRRFKELYPESNMNYAEYKEYQKKNAFKKARPSEEIKRLVR